MNEDEAKWSDYRKKPEIKHCLVCDISIKAYGSKIRRATKQFCSRKCRGKHQTKEGVVIKPCKNCGQQVFITGSRKAKKFNTYCSFECFGLSKRSPYYNPSESLKVRWSWDYRKWRTTVFERDNYTCQECGIRGGKLNADHIKPFAYYPELRLDLNNGRTLCILCHRKTPTYGGRQRRN